MAPRSQITGSETWDFLTGRGAPTAQDRAVPVERFAAVMLGAALRGSEAFWEQAEVVSSAEDPIRQAGRIVAGYYVPNRSPGQAAIARLLEVAGTAPSRRRAEFRLLNASPGSYYPDAPLEPGMPRYALRVDRQELLEEGAGLVAHRGALRCLTCRAPLHGRHQEPTGAGLRERKRWRDYCDGCDLDWRSHGRHRDAIRTVLEGAAPVILDVEDRRRSRRLRDD